MVTPLYENKVQESDKHDVHGALKALKSPVAIAPNVRADLYAICTLLIVVSGHWQKA